MGSAEKSGVRRVGHGAVTADAAGRELTVGIALPFLEPGRAGGGQVATEVLLRALDRFPAGGLRLTAQCSRANLGWFEEQALESADSAVVATHTPRGTLARGATLAFRTRLPS